MNYATASNTATGGSDYAAASGTLSFSAGPLSRTINVYVKPDVWDEGDERFFVNLSNPTNGAIGDPQGAGTIIDNDPRPSLMINDVTVAEGDSGAVNAVFTARLSAPSGQTVTVAYSCQTGTTAGSDYAAMSGTLTFSAGVTTQTISVPGHGRHARRSERGVLRQPVEPGSGNRRRRSGQVHHRRRRSIILAV